MADWSQILEELQKAGNAHDVVRRKYLNRLYQITGRNIITYYSGWLQKPHKELVPYTAIDDNDKNGFMNAIHQLDTSKGLDLILHTPGGELSAVESIIDYLKDKFSDIRVVVPQIAMSGGTIIACASNRILMGRQSSLGPIDPQFSGIPAHGILEEFNKAYEDIKKDQSYLYVWQPIINKYSPTTVGESQKAVDWANNLVEEYLKDRMLKNLNTAKKTSVVKDILKELGDHSTNLSHSRHISAKKCKKMGLKIEMMEKDNKLQDAILSVHHCYTHTLSATAAIKVIENHRGSAYVQQIRQAIVAKELQAV